MTTVKAKKALSPIPGASAKGNFAHKAITRVATIADIAVAEKTAFLSMPVAERISGLTARIYAIVMKVVIPAKTSVLTFVLLLLSLKYFSNIPVIFKGWNYLLTRLK